MQSSQVSVGDTATATQYNNARADVVTAGYYPINQIDSDTINEITEALIGDLKAASFPNSGTSTGYFDVQIPEVIDTGEDWNVRLSFDMTTSDASESVVLELQYASIADGGDTTPSLTTLTETVSCPDTLETLSVVTLSTILIPQAALAGGRVVSFRLSRLGNDASDTHNGSFRLIEMQLFQQ